jgi:RNA polymerase-binding transcription factor DksA
VSARKQCVNSNRLLPGAVETVKKGERQNMYAPCERCHREIPVYLSDRWRYKTHADGKNSNLKERTGNGNCHRTDVQRGQNVVYRAATAHVGHCRKCGKPFWRSYTTEEEYEAYWMSNRRLVDPMPMVGWGKWMSWSPTSNPYLIQEGP